MYFQKVRGHFDAAHFLPGYQGKCANLHGHRWEVVWTVKTPVLENGMGADFGWLKTRLENVLEVFDHSIVNMRLENPTAENIAKMLYLELSVDLPSTFPYLQMHNLEVFESPDSSVTYWEG